MVQLQLAKAKIMAMTGEQANDNIYTMVINKGQQLATLLSLSVLSPYQIDNFCKQEPKMPTPEQVLAELDQLSKWLNDAGVEIGKSSGPC